jgi:hypothetical protein
MNLTLQRSVVWAFCFGMILGVLGGEPQLSAQSVTPPAGAHPVAEWRFNQSHDLKGWQPNGDLKEVAITNGVLSCLGAGSDPILEFLPSLELQADPQQYLEVKLLTTQDGVCEFFWSHTREGRYGGFSQEMSERFNVTGDAQWHTYQVFPFWQPAGRIVRLRFDLFDGASFKIESIRIMEIAGTPAVGRAEFQFTNNAQGWRSLPETALSPAPNGLKWTKLAPKSLIFNPSLRLNADTDNCVSLRLAASRNSLPSQGDGSSQITLLFATERGYGWKQYGFPVTTDGREHTYQLDLWSAPDWRGRIIALGLSPGEDLSDIRLCWLKISDSPQGAAELKPVSMGMDTALPRVGSPLVYRLILANQGGEVASNIEVQARFPAGVRMRALNPTNATLAALGFGEEASWTWELSADLPIALADVQLTCQAANAPELSWRGPIQIRPALNMDKAKYVPEPRPVRGRTDVGVYYFPGWKSASQWQPLHRFPERKPVLGWYREGDPEVADWHIKWAVEHGITFFAYDWYWNRGARQLEHALHEGYFHARYRHLLKFCLLWANHNPVGTSSLEDCVAVTRYWIENYFRRPEYLTVAGKPVMIIFAPVRLTEDLSSAQVKQALNTMRAECVRAGLPGIYFIACVGEAGQARLSATEGYDAVTAYNWPFLGMSPWSKQASFETLAESYARQWSLLLASSSLPLLVPVSGGWDSRPWHGDAAVTRYDRTPDVFRRHLQSARSLLESPLRTNAVPNLVLIEAWNEWGEGSYIEPHAQWGFDYLDAVRQVFAAAAPVHDDVTPSDVGLGPYDVREPDRTSTAWQFDQDNAGWEQGMDITDLSATNGCLRARTSGNDPAFFSPPIQARASQFKSAVIRLRLARPGSTGFEDHAQLFWRSLRLPESEATSARFEISGDGQWHEYTIPVGLNPRWRGTITRLRLDPCNQAGVFVDLGAVSLRP